MFDIAIYYIKAHSIDFFLATVHSCIWAGIALRFGFLRYNERFIDFSCTGVQRLRTIRGWRGELLLHLIPCFQVVKKLILDAWLGNKWLYYFFIFYWLWKWHCHFSIRNVIRRIRAMVWSSFDCFSFLNVYFQNLQKILPIAFLTFSG